MAQPSCLENLAVFALQSGFGFGFGFAGALSFQRLSTEPARFY
ncbi:hypothetical protein [Ralstonia pseudosolanacearum]